MKPYFTVCALLENDGRFLFVQENNGRDRGKWGLPGGHVELGETIIDAVRREVYEEVGIDSEPTQLLHVSEQSQRGRITFTFMVRYQPPDFFVGDHIRAYLWLTQAEILEKGARGLLREVASMWAQQCLFSNSVTIPIISQSLYCYAEVAREISQWRHGDRRGSLVYN